jgi:hypothetical protein
MNANDSENISSALEHPTTLRIFLYLRHSNSKSSDTIGVRETQRALRIKSPSIAKWHVEKLENAGFIEKLSSNRFQLTDVGLNQNIRVPVKISVLLVKGIIIPKISFLATLVFISVIITIGFAFWKPLVGAINGILSLFAILAFLIIQFIKLRKDLQSYNMFLEE